MEANATRRTFLVEHYWPGVTAAQFRAAAERVRRSAEQLAAGGSDIVFLHSTLVPEDESAFCVFSAASAELVADAYRRAGVALERILDALEIEPRAGLPVRAAAVPDTEEEP